VTPWAQPWPASIHWRKGPPDDQTLGRSLPASTLTLDPRETATSALPSYIKEIERAAIKHALQENRHRKPPHRTRTAASLGITFRALRYKLKKLGLD